MLPPINNTMSVHCFIGLVSLAIGSFETSPGDGLMGSEFASAAGCHRLSHLRRAQHTRSFVCIHIYVPTRALHSRGALSIHRLEILASYWRVLFCPDGAENMMENIFQRHAWESDERGSDPISNQLTYISSPPFTRGAARLKKSYY